MRNHLLLLTLITWSFQALANTEEVTDEVNKNKTSVQKNLDKFKRVVFDESMANRDNKKYQVNATLFGNSFDSTSTAFEIGKFRDANSIISLQYESISPYHNYSSEEGDMGEDDNLIEDEGKGYAVNFTIKKFTSNSFYYKAGIYYRKQTLFSRDFNSVTNSYDRYDFTDMGASFRIGNQWQWDEFTLGCDWIGFSKSIATLDETRGTEVYDLDGTSGLNFYLGYSFQ